MPSSRLIRLLIPALLAALSACRVGGAPEVKDARVVLPPPGTQMAAGYFRIENHGSAAFLLREVSSPAFESVQMHETVTDQGMSRMRAVEQVQVPVGGSASFEPGGLHLMMSGFKQDLSSLHEIPVDLELVAADGAVTHLAAKFVLRGSADAGHDH
ncbi:MAG: copper chaperone PCu(A)C [Panacagrimonas sp.]